MDPVRLAKSAGHLCQQFIAGNPYIYGKAKFFTDAVPDPHGGSGRTSKEVQGAAHIHKGLVNTVLFHRGRIFIQDLDKGIGTFLVKPIIGGNHIKSGTFLTGLQDRLPGMDAEVFCRSAFGKNNAVPCRHIPGDRGRNGAQIQGAAQMMKTVCGFPGEKRTVHINMVDNSLHGYYLL